MSFPRLSPDGNQVAVTIADGSNVDVWLLDPVRRSLDRRLTTHPGEDIGAVWHPGGRQLAYVSDDTGSPEVYVQPFPGPGDRHKISARDGAEPLWSRDGREIFYREGRLLVAVQVDGSGERFQAGEPQMLFEADSGNLTDSGASTANYDVSLDGSRFLIIRHESPITATVIDIVLKWPETLGVQ